MIGTKPLRIRFDKISGFIKIHDGSRYLTLFVSETYDAIYNRIVFYKSKRQCHIYLFSLLCENQNRFLWFFTYRKKIDFLQYSLNQFLIKIKVTTVIIYS